MNNSLIYILDPLFDCISHEVGLYRLDIADLLSFASTCKGSANKHTELLEKQMDINHDCKFGRVYNTNKLHGVEIRSYVVNYRMGKLDWSELEMWTHNFGRRTSITNVIAVYGNHNGFITVRVNCTCIEYKVAHHHKTEFTIGELLQIVRNIIKCGYNETYRRTESGPRRYSFNNNDVNDVRKKFRIIDDFEVSGDYETAIQILGCL